MSVSGERYPGVYAAMATPLTAERAVDAEGVKRVATYLLDNGIHGLSILGSNGECSALTRAQRQEVLAATMEVAGDRGTVFTGAAGIAVQEVIDDLKAAEGSGAKGALVPPPFYYPLDTRAVVDFFERVAEASPVPILLYNIPRMTKVQLAVEAVVRLAEHPNIIGIKDSSGDFSYFTQIAQIGKSVPGFTVLTGSDGLLAASLYVGGHGIIGGGVNVVPDWMAELYRAATEGDRERAMELQEKVIAAVAATRIGVFPAGSKGQYYLKGLAEPYPAYPIPPLTDGELSQLRKSLTELGILKAQ